MTYNIPTKTASSCRKGGMHMKQYQDIFKRYEKKYLLNPDQYKRLKQRLEGKLEPDRFGKSTISNIYFDTPDHCLIQRSLEKPVYKEKLRLRSYGTPGMSDTVFVELKKKYKSIVYKRRVDMSLKEAVHYLYDLKPYEKPSQITKEIDWFLSYYEGISPAMFISYDRTALYSIEDPNLRITFDRNILWREEDLKLDYGVWGDSLLEQGQRVMEIKIPDAMPLWLSHILDDLQIYPTSLSKYGRGYQESLKAIKTKKGVMKSA